jgi:hypothetical protein
MNGGLYAIRMTPVRLSLSSAKNGPGPTSRFRYHRFRLVKLYQVRLATCGGRTVKVGVAKRPNFVWRHQKLDSGAT